MADYYITPTMAKSKLHVVGFAGSLLGLPQNFTKTDAYRGANRDEFERYVLGHGIKHFSVKEIVTPHHKSKAKVAGYTEFVPPIHLWPWALLVLRLGDLMRDHVGEPVRLRNLYRPYSYNKLVAKSSIESDHPNACGGDFDFRSVESRREAEQLIRSIAGKNPFLEVSLGMGGRSLHIGTLSPKGSRCWFYPSYADKRVMLQKGFVLPEVTV